ncbi:MAG: glycosyltransferase family 4 protein [candidate division Zixibacteria bacterium]|nr:glycosyltransferase family 4 protein [candidate division Zixibacteria bacterium]
MRTKRASSIDLKSLRVAIVHEWFVNYCGAERVVEQILKVFPQADLYAQIDFLPEEMRGFIQNKKVNTSFIQKLPRARKNYRSYLPLMPFAVEQFDLSAYDLIISSNYAVAKGVITGPNQLHISYVHSPIRYAWDLTHQYLKETGLNKGLKGLIAKLILHYIRFWDTRTANGVDRFLGNSEFICRRIKKVYGRNATVIYPPVEVDAFSVREDKADFYLTASRMVPYKRIDLIVEAFSRMPDKKLVVIGDGPEFGKIRRMAGDNVTLLGYQPFEVLKDHLQLARAFIFAAEEDFGILPVEAQACGTPVIAYGRGGALETIINGHTGIFFHRQEVDSLVAAVTQFERSASGFDPHEIRRNTLRFSEERFCSEFREFVQRAIDLQFRYQVALISQSLSVRKKLEFADKGEVDKATIGEPEKNFVFPETALSRNFFHSPGEKPCQPTPSHGDPK